MTCISLTGGDLDPVYNVRWAGSTVGGPDRNLRWGIDDADMTLTENSVNTGTYLNAVMSYNAYNMETAAFYSTGPVDGNHGTEAGYQRYL